MDAQERNKCCKIHVFFFVHNYGELNPGMSSVRLCQSTCIPRDMDSMEPTTPCSATMYKCESIQSSTQNASVYRLLF